MKHILFAIFCFILADHNAAADERILSFHSNIQVLTDGSMKVNESVTVRAEGKNIKRGIYRDFPANYKDRPGNNYQVDVRVESVKRDGKNEDYHIQARPNYVLRDNRDVFVACIGLLLLCAYYLIVWMKVGRDPEKDVVVAAYAPAAGYSPAAVRYIEKTGYDKTCFAAAIINLAVKGYLTISESADDYSLKKTGNICPLAADEKALADRLFRSNKSITLEQDNYLLISAALDAHKASLERNYEKEYFLTNRSYFIFGAGLTIVLLVATLLAMPAVSDLAAAVFMSVWLTGWSVGVMALVTNAMHLWRSAHNTSSVSVAIFNTLFALGFVAAELMGLTVFAGLTSWSMVLVFISAVIINWLFYELLKAPTRAGRKLLDKMEGFRRYVDIADRHELDYRHPQGRCPELFEACLPYALALGIEQKWGEQFADVLVKAQASGAAGYHPVWYHGSHWDHHHIGGFSSSLGSSFSNALNSSSTAPGCSSGGGGGGNTGAGGGGGGGGGW